ncbi:MAG TPA: hypothetical protein VHB18_10785 [Mycobacteriales bacterium]|nr:hypothetical protein [Mycobacteriales bacterium]
MTQLDLHDIVPEPPEELLAWSTLDRRIRRHSVARQALAVGSAAVIVAGVVSVGVSVGGSKPTQPPLGPISRADGRIVFAQPTSVLNKYWKVESLYTLDPQTGDTTRIMELPDEVDQLVASPDGRRIAYSEDTYGYGPAGHPTHVNSEQVHVANADGSNDHKIFSCPNSWCGDLDWSPDGERLLIRGTWVLQPDGQVERVCVGECTVRNYTSDASWSPDGTKLAFQYWKDIPLDNGGSDTAGMSTVQAIGVMNADGTNPRLVTDQHCTAKSVEGNCFTDTNPSWSPTGNAIAFTRTPLSALPQNGSLGGPALFGPSAINMVRSDGSDLHRVLSCARYCSIRTVTWSPTGEQLAFVTQDTRGLRGKPPWSLHIVNPHSGAEETTPLTFMTDAETPTFVWAPSGSHIAIGSVAGDGTQVPGIYLVAVTDGRRGSPQPAATNGIAPITWLPRTGASSGRFLR